MHMPPHLGPTPALRNGISCFMLLLTAFAGGAQTTAPAVSDLQTKADAITKIEVKRTESTQLFADGKTHVDFDVRAYDVNKNEVKLTHAEANELFKCNLIQKPVQAGGPDVLRNGVDLFFGGDNGRNIWRTTTADGTGSAELEVKLHEKYAAGRVVAGYARATVAGAIVGKDIVQTVAPHVATVAKPRPVVPARHESPARSHSWGSVKKATRSVKDHPYIAAGAGVAAVVVGAAVLGGGSGGGSGGADPIESGSGGVSRFAGSLSGEMSGTTGDIALASGFTMDIESDGSVTFSCDWGSASGSINEHGTVSGDGFSGTVTRSGNTLHGSGSWAVPRASGGWSGSGPASQ